MAAKKREIYARAAVQLRTHDRPVIAEQRCPGAMGLYLFLLLQARGEQTDGDVSEIAAYASWGALTAYRKRQARALIDAGLVELCDGRLFVVKYGDHNDVRSVIDENRSKEREKKRGQRTNVPPVSLPMSPGDIEGTSQGTTPVVPYSSSYSGTCSGSSGSDPDLPDRLDQAPAWFSEAIATVEQQTGESLRPPDCWLRYSGHRSNKGLPKSQRDAVYWLTTVMVPEARKERRAESDKREREAKWTRQRAGPATAFAEPKVLSEAEQRELAELVPMRRRARTGTE